MHEDKMTAKTPNIMQTRSLEQSNNMIANIVIKQSIKKPSVI